MFLIGAQVRNTKTTELKDNANVEQLERLQMYKLDKNKLVGF